MPQTKLPPGWKRIRLGEIFKERKETNSSSLELLSVTNSDGIVPRSSIVGKDNSSEDKSKYKKVCVGDIAYNTMRMWQGVSALSDYEGIVSPAYTVLKPTNKAYARYFSYLFKLQSSVNLFNRFSQGMVADTNSLKYEVFAKLQMNIPPLPEQKKIAEILTAADELIAVKQRYIEAKQKQKKWLMQNLLTGKIRLPGFSGEWKRKDLNHLISQRSERNTKYLTQKVLSVSNKFGFIPQSENFTQGRVIASEDTANYLIVRKGFYAYNPARINVGSIARLDNCDIGIISPMYTCFAPKEKHIDSNYLLHFFNSSIFNIDVKRRCAGSVRQTLNYSELCDISLKLPPIKEQSAIAEILTTADREIELLRRELGLYKLHKRALMQQLLTGKIRVKGDSNEREYA
jgi:type I restriction enzyme S subunit